MVAQRCKKIISIIKVSEKEEGDEVKIEGTKPNHCEKDSNLSQDVLTFDFHGSIDSLDMKRENSGQIIESNGIAKANDINIEFNPLNEHECIFHLIGTMTDKMFYWISCCQNCEIRQNL